MRKVLTAVVVTVAVMIGMVVVPVRAGLIEVWPERDVYGYEKSKRDPTLGYQNKHSTQSYGYWGVGPDYGSYRWPYKGPYGERPRGRPMDALTYAPVAIEADRASAKLLSKTAIRVFWPGGPEGVRSVDFAILGEADEVMIAQNDDAYPYSLDMALPDPAQKVRVTVNYVDGFSTAVFWVPWK